MSTLAPISGPSRRREAAIAWCERRIARYELELKQPAAPVDAVIAHRAIVSAEIADHRRRLELLRRAA